MAEGRYIAVEGPLGVGKRAFAAALAEHVSARLLTEVRDNPFLPNFYEQERQNAFQTQLYFLLARYQEQFALLQGELFARGGIVTNYLFAKDSIYARIALSPDEHVLYERIFDLLRTRVPRPDLVIYLQARPEVLLGRIRKRGVASERAISLDYVETVAKAYHEFFFHWEESPLLAIDTSGIELATGSREMEELIGVALRQKGGKQHYIPLGS